ncbi:hypothetical protein FIBSPDRAFT_1036230 [Athelia psychrophila]|uniref:DUF6533 domain-containing protein n=1 Tax=Athelia psychrophila TaxID=1759441 RepID=A0A166VUB7_9AGAM|nr:hypothetical protein FIBSPDRAFT_1036230 [Fibularhizoctonia sp. CBS 109695]
MASSTPADYLPPAVEAELFDAQLYGYMIIAAVVVYAYDWLLSVSDEVEIVSQRGLSWPIAIYFLSRVSECTHVVLIAVIILAPIDNCVSIFVASGVCSTMSIATTSYLFLLRVQAVYHQSRPITVVFGCFWLVTIALNILTSSTAGTRVEHVPGTQSCTSTDTKYFALPSVSSFVNDTLIFLAISYRLAANAATEQNWRSWILSITKGKGLYRLSRSLMQSGQAYYAAIILFFFVNLAMMCSPLVPVIMHYSLINTYIAFTNLMACKIFRGIALGMMQDNPSSWNTARISAALEAHAPHRLAGRQSTDRAA